MQLCSSAPLMQLLMPSVRRDAAQVQLGAVEVLLCLQQAEPHAAAGEWLGEGGKGRLCRETKLIMGKGHILKATSKTTPCCW